MSTLESQAWEQIQQELSAQDLVNKILEDHWFSEEEKADFDLLVQKLKEEKEGVIDISHESEKVLIWQLIWQLFDGVNMPDFSMHTDHNGDTYYDGTLDSGEGVMVNNKWEYYINGDFNSHKQQLNAVGGVKKEQLNNNQNNQKIPTPEVAVSNESPETKMSNIPRIEDLKSNYSVASAFMEQHGEKWALFEDTENPVEYNGKKYYYASRLGSEPGSIEFFNIALDGSQMSQDKLARLISLWAITEAQWTWGVDSIWKTKKRDTQDKAPDTAPIPTRRPISETEGVITTPFLNNSPTPRGRPEKKEEVMIPTVEEQAASPRVKTSVSNIGQIWTVDTQAVWDTSLWWVDNVQVSSWNPVQANIDAALMDTTPDIDTQEWITENHIDVSEKLPLTSSPLPREKPKRAEASEEVSKERQEGISPEKQKIIDDYQVMFEKTTQDYKSLIEKPQTLSNLKGSLEDIMFILDWATNQFYEWQIDVSELEGLIPQIEEKIKKLGAGQGGSVEPRVDDERQEVTDSSEGEDTNMSETFHLYEWLLLEADKKWLEGDTSAYSSAEYTKALEYFLFDAPDHEQSILGEGTLQGYRNNYIELANLQWKTAKGAEWIIPVLEKSEDPHHIDTVMNYYNISGDIDSAKVHAQRLVDYAGFKDSLWETITAYVEEARILLESSNWESEWSEASIEEASESLVLKNKITLWTKSKAAIVEQYGENITLSNIQERIQSYIDRWAPNLKYSKNVTNTQRADGFAFQIATSLLWNKEVTKKLWVIDTGFGGGSWEAMWMVLWESVSNPTFEQAKKILTMLEGKKDMSILDIETEKKSNERVDLDAPDLSELFWEEVSQKSIWEARAKILSEIETTEDPQRKKYLQKIESELGLLIDWLEKETGWRKKILENAWKHLWTHESTWAADKFMEWYERYGVPADAKKFSWCAGYVNWVLKESGYPWIDSPRAVGFLWLPPQRGHVWFYVDGKILWWNQSNRVSLLTINKKMLWWVLPEHAGDPNMVQKTEDNIPNGAIVVFSREKKDANMR